MGTSVDARPSDALALALVSDAPIFVHSDVLEQSDRHRSAFSDLLDEADRATDDARVLADEVRARLQATAEELSARTRRLM